MGLRQYLGPPKFFNASLHACHSFTLTSLVLHILTNSDDLVLLSVRVKTLSDQDSSFRSYINFQELRDSLRPTCFSVYASPVLFAGIPPAPPQAQDSIRVAG